MRPLTKISFGTFSRNCITRFFILKSANTSNLNLQCISMKCMTFSKPKKSKGSKIRKKISNNSKGPWPSRSAVTSRPSSLSKHKSAIWYADHHFHLGRLRNNWTVASCSTQVHRQKTTMTKVLTTDLKKNWPTHKKKGRSSRREYFRARESVTQKAFTSKSRETQNKRTQWKILQTIQRNKSSDSIYRKPIRTICEGIGSERLKKISGFCRLLPICLKF
jgi:hypothetical protein